MGNTNQPASSSDSGQSKMKGWPLTFHENHSDNVQLTADRRRAKRIETFCKGICFSGRPILPNEHVFLRFSEVSTSWSGAIRFGFMSHDPATLDRSTLPRYACPDLTNCPGYWAKALPERLARNGSVLLFYFTPTGDVMFGINGEDKGVFFSGITARMPLWALLDIYGNTVSVEFVDSYQLNNAAISTNTTRPQSTVSLDGGMLDWFASSMSFNVARPTTTSSLASASSMPFLPVRSLPESLLLPFSFFVGTVGRNICLSSDGSVAVRRVEDYCNAYVFTRRPFRPSETLVIQVMSVDLAYTGGLAFGMTCCEPGALSAEMLPDDSDLLLDRLEYWIVNKDVCANAEIADELTFYLTDEGEVHYSRNGRYLSTLMHIDKSLPMWAFFDVYGSIQKIKMLGVIDGPPPWENRLQQPDLTISLPPVSALLRDPSDTSATVPPPRPPPPRSSPTTLSNVSSRALPSLPPKQHQRRALSYSQAREPTHHLIPTPFFVAATAFPAPPSQPVATVPHHHHHHHRSSASSLSLPHQRSRNSVSNNRPTGGLAMSGSRPPGDSPTGVEDRSEMADNASNECSVCLEKPSDCVLYTCGHMCMCYDCAISVQRTDGASCPICRQPIRDVIKIFRT